MIVSNGTPDGPGLPRAEVTWLALDALANDGSGEGGQQKSAFAMDNRALDAMWVMSGNDASPLSHEGWMLGIIMEDIQLNPNQDRTTQLVYLEGGGIESSDGRLHVLTASSCRDGGQAYFHGPNEAAYGQAGLTQAGDMIALNSIVGGNLIRVHACLGCAIRLDSSRPRGVAPT